MLDENLLLQKKEYDKLINERDTIGNLHYCQYYMYTVWCDVYDMFAFMLYVYAYERYHR